MSNTELNTTYLEWCPVCRCLVLMKLHTRDMCKHLSSVRSSIFGESQEGKSDLTLERILRICSQLEATMQEHERTCVMCSYWVEEDSNQRCDDYQELRDKRHEWAKRHDDAH